eukprot:4931923-Karenia_brevis.AAC.1
MQFLAGTGMLTFQKSRHASTRKLESGIQTSTQMIRTSNQAACRYLRSLTFRELAVLLRNAGSKRLQQPEYLRMRCKIDC